MKYKLHIPYVNGEHLLRNAVESVRDIGNIHVWADGCPPKVAPVIEGATVHAMPPLHRSSAQNTIFHASWDDDVCFFMHHDGLAKPGYAAKLLKLTEQHFLSGDKWGVIFTFYDVLCAFNMAAVRDTGFWDDAFFHYVVDDDYYRRLRLGGWREIEAGQDENEGVEHIGGSATVAADPIFKHRVNFMHASDRAYYNFKWGGPHTDRFHLASRIKNVPGQEKFAIPFQNVVESRARALQPGPKLFKRLPGVGVKA